MVIIAALDVGSLVPFGAGEHGWSAEKNSLFLCTTVLE